VKSREQGTGADLEGPAGDLLDAARDSQAVELTVTNSFED
jgi:hypothetical protein